MHVQVLRRTLRFSRAGEKGPGIRLLIHRYTLRQGHDRGDGRAACQVDLILIDGEPADFSTLLEGGERVTVYPACNNLDVAPEHRLIPPPPKVYRFVLDVHLGRLARYLRLAGFDTLYSNTYSDPEIVRIAEREDRIVLTRDTGILKHSAVTRGYWLRSTSPRAQLGEVVERFDLHPHFTPFSRCMMCNGGVRAADVSEVRGRIPSRVAQNFDRFRICDDCGRVYWPGSHHEKLAALLEEQARTPRTEA